jgi:hypothetical protein
MVEVRRLLVAQRSLYVVAGGLMAVWGNYLPKLMSPWPPEEEAFDWHRVHRFVGWVCSGTASAGC